MREIQIKTIMRYHYLLNLLLFNHSVMSNSLWPHGLQHTRFSCPSPSPGACSNSCPSSWWCHPTISSCHPFLLLPSIFPSIRVFSNESALHIRWPKYWSFSFSISPSNEYSGLISFGIDWLDLLAVQETLKSLLQHHSSKASILWCSAFFMAQLSHPYMTTGKTIALARWTFVGQVMSLLFNMLSRFVITFLPRSKRLLISWLQSPSAVILDFVTLWTVAHQAPLSRGFSRQEYWTGLPCPPPGDLSDPGSNPCLFSSPVLVGGFFTTSATWEAPYIYS